MCASCNCLLTPGLVLSLLGDYSSSMLPVELLRGIISTYFEMCTPPDNKGTSLSYRDNVPLKPDWHAVEPLSLVSRVVRRMTLELWFLVFRVNDPAQLEDLSPIPEVAAWTR